MTALRDRLFDVWRRVLGLAWPVMVEQTSRTLMRTTDIIITAQFSAAAVVAIGLADLYARIPLRIGLGLGGGAIALSSQDTGAAASVNRDEAITQAVLMGALAGVPFVLLGLLFGRGVVAFLGADPGTAALGGTYLAIIFATAPARHVALIGARSLQGTGDTRTPMYVNLVANGLNISLSAVLGLGLFGVQRYGVVGVGAATAFANVFTATLLLAALWTDWSPAGLVRPRSATIAKQLLVVSIPRIGEGVAATLAEFPFNALLLGFGTEVNAGFQIGRRMYQQVTGPLGRGYNVAASVLVGQRLGEGDAGRARFEGWAVAALGLATVGAIGIGLVFASARFVSVFTDAPETVPYAVRFAQVYGASAPLLVAFTVLGGALQGAGDTRVPFVARVTGTAVFMLGTTYVVGDLADYGALGAYLGIGLSYACMALIVGWGFRSGDWADRAAEMMAARGSAED